MTISGSGEPTLSPLSITRILDLTCKLKKENMNYDWINLYSNGVRIGEDKDFCDEYLGLWKELGLKTIYVTVHDVNEGRNAKIYGRSDYPPLDLIVSRIHDENILTRANLVLNKRNIGDCDKFVYMVEHLREIGFDHISAWPLRTLDDKVDSKLAPSEEELDKMSEWVEKNQNSSNRIRLLREKDKVVYSTGQKLTLFPDGTLSSSWCN